MGQLQEPASCLNRPISDKESEDAKVVTVVESSGFFVLQQGHTSWLGLLVTMHVGQFHESASCLNKFIKDVESDDVAVFIEFDIAGFLVLQQGHNA